ncbi:MAG: tRNA pseudouridine(55) synthase TruB, partial [Polyangiaceae bacterium]
DGVRSHVLARRGEVVDHAPRDVRVATIEIRSRTEDPPAIELSLDVSKGYYVRSLARDLAASLGTAGHLTALRRTRSGCFSLSDACALSDENLAERILSLEVAAARALPTAHLTAKGRVDAFEGRPIAPTDLSDATASGPCAWFDETGTLVAIGEIEESGRGQVLRGFR